jgi:hypothetical protein
MSWNIVKTECCAAERPEDEWRIRQKFDSGKLHQLRRPGEPAPESQEGTSTVGWGGGGHSITSFVTTVELLGAGWQIIIILLGNTVNILVCMQSFHTSEYRIHKDVIDVEQYL